MKSKIRNLILFVLLLIVGAQGTAIYLIYAESKEDKQYIQEFEQAKFEKLSFVSDVEANYETTEYDAMQAVEKQSKAVDDLKISGWIPDWDFADGVDTVKGNSDVFTGVNPFWYEINADGSLKELRNVNDPELSSYLRNNNIELIPTITSFDTDIASELLSSDSSIERHVSSIVTAVVENGYDGIDLDYESIYLKDKESFFKFLQQLSIEMISENKKLTFTAHPKWGDEVYYSGLPQTRMVLDYKRIADLVDELRIMTYEYTGRANLYYGPNSPLPWMEDVIRYAIIKGVPRDKIVIGSATYSYDYLLRDPMPSLEYYPTFVSQISDKENAFAYYNEIVDEVKDNNSYEEEFNAEWGEMVLKYKFEGNDRVIVYPNDESIQLRMQLAADYGIRGVAFWRLGDEGNLSYK